MTHLNQYGYDHEKFMARVDRLESRTKSQAKKLFDASKVKEEKQMD